MGFLSKTVLSRVVDVAARLQRWAVRSEGKEYGPAPKELGK